MKNHWYPLVPGARYPERGGGLIGKKDALPLTLPLEIRNHDSSHLVKKIEHSWVYSKLFFSTLSFLSESDPCQKNGKLRRKECEYFSGPCLSYVKAVPD